MNRLASFTMVAVMAAPALAHAQRATGAQGTVGVTGMVSTKCGITISSAVINIAELSDVSGDVTAGQLRPANVNGQHAALVGFCVGAASSMRAQAFPILATSAGSPPSGFTTRVDYIATATVHPSAGDVSATANSNSLTPGTAVVVGTFGSNIDVTLSNASSNGAKLLAGPYQGSVGVTLTPTV